MTAEAETPAEIEEGRLDRMTEWEDGELDGFTPESVGHHEALHMASVFADMLDRHLCGHGAIVRDRELYALAHGAFGNLWALYQELAERSRDAP